MVKLYYVEKILLFFKTMHHVRTLCTFWGVGITPSGGHASLGTAQQS